MHPAVIEFMVRIAESSVPIVTGMVTNHVRANAQKTILNSYSENISKQQKILSQHDHGGNGHIGKFNPSMPDNIGRENIEKNTTEAPFIEVNETGDLDQLHQEKWNEYFGELYDLPDNASTGHVVKTMKKIEADIKNYPCPSCQENAKVHLTSMKEENDQFDRVSTKKDGIMKLCRFKNHINEMKGNEIYPCEALIN